MSSSSVHKRAADTGADAPNGNESGTLSSSSTENNGISSTNGTAINSGQAASTGGNISSSGLDSSSKISSSSSTNPFVSSSAKLTTTVSDSNGTSSAITSSSRPVIAPSKLGGFRMMPCAVPSAAKNSNNVVSSSVVAPSVLAPSRLFGSPVGAASLAGGSRGIEQQQQSGAKFKLKPSILSSSVPSNPFLKSIPSEQEVSSDSTKEDGVSSLSSSKEGPSSSSSGSPSKTDAADSSSEGTDASLGQASTSADAGPSSKAPDQISSSNTTDATSPGKSASIFGNFSPKSSSADSNKSITNDAPQQSGLTSNGTNISSSLFMPSAAISSQSSSSSFIFGQNLQSRVTNESAAIDAKSNGDEKAPSGGAIAASVSSDNLFSAAASEFASSSSSNPSQSENGVNEVKSLATSSRELAEKESNQKRKFDEVEVITGEETESNVLQMNCKVYTWHKGGGWVERGRGILRLNDWGSGGVEMHSRLVIRTQGTLTIMLNTKIWKEMSVEKPSEKGVKFTALDPDGQIKLYLVMGGQKDIELLFTSLECRVANSKRREQETGPTSSASKKSRADE